ncbi:MAG: 16S rRNA (uracil(1498)-N(3))-methyltransferase [Chlamydiia bacterium]|nr:16S rRNA (uracil(1498)-N(3))-methyltransferase [Chlamydiia bacterium]
MPHDRFFLDALLDKDVSLTGDELYHLSRVMRKKEGDRVELVNGKGMLAEGVISSLSKGEAKIHITFSKIVEPLLPPIHLVQALPKMSHLEMVVQKGTELGASHFHLYPSALSEKKELSPNQWKRLQTIIIGAMKQCGRLDLPSLSWGFPPLEGNAYFGDLSPSAVPLKNVSLPATIIIGPEKGFTHKEVEELRKKAKGVLFSPYTLRAETAAIAALAVLANNTIYTAHDSKLGFSLHQHLDL